MLVSPLNAPKTHNYIDFCDSREFLRCNKNSLQMAQKCRNMLRLYNLLNPAGNVMHRQFNIQQFYILPTLYLLRTNSDLCHLQHKLIGFYNQDEIVYSAVRTGSLNKAVCAST